jgi:type I restriction enzyme S subunit
MEVKPGYKRTDAGVIPEEWDDSMVGREFEIKLGKMLDAEKNVGVAKPYVGNKAVQWDRIDISELPTVPMSRLDIERFRLRKGDLLVCEGGEVGRGAIWDAPIDECYYQKALHRLRPLRGFDSRIMAALLRQWADCGLLANYVTQTSIAHLPREKFMDVPMPVPPPAEQRAIAEALSDVDALLGALDRLIVKKRDLKQAAMQQLLTGQARLTGFHGEWEVKTLGDLFNFSGGYSASRDQLSEEGHCYLHYGDIHGTTKTFADVRADYQDIPKLNIPLKRVSSKSMLEDGDVVFVDASEDDEGTSRHIVVVNKERKPFISGLHTIVAKSKTDELVHEYRRYCFQTAAIRQQFLFYAVGKKVTGISKTNIGKLTMPVPKVPEQIAIAEVLSDMDAELAALEERREKISALKQGMMQELLTGRIRLVSPVRSVVPLPQAEDPATPRAAHNWQINEAVVIGALTLQFGTEEWPLPRKRRVKLTYLLHRRAEGKAEGFLKKAAGPYNPKIKYQGPEAIALKNGYVREHNNGTYAGFVAGEKIAQAEQYFAEWYPGAKEWVEQFHFEKTDELELLATVDMAVEDLRSRGRAVALKAVKEVIRTHPEWEAKLSRSIFSDGNIKRAIGVCRNLFGS